MPLCSGIERLWRVSGEVLRRGVWHRRCETLPRERDDSNRPARQLALLDPSAAVLGAVRRRRWYAYIRTYILGYLFSIPSFIAHCFLKRWDRTNSDRAEYAQVYDCLPAHMDHRLGHPCIDCS
jgi:hypothetical protein